MKLETEIRNHIESGLKEHWNIALTQCTSEEIDELSIEYDKDLDSVIEDIMSSITNGIEELYYTIDNFLFMKDDTYDIHNMDPTDDSWLADLPSGTEEETNVDDEPYEGISLESNINEVFKY